MTNHHFGEIGDVWKHLALAEILTIEKPESYWESHCGSASYEMDDAWTRRYGIRHFLSRAPEVPDLASSRYYEQASELAAQGTYAGSGLLAMRLLGGSSRYLFCDVDDASTKSLEVAASDMKIVTRCLNDDGINVLWNGAMFTPRVHAGVFVHIDPFRPFEVSPSYGLSSLDLASRMAEAGFMVFFWYSFNEGDTWEDRGWAWRRLSPGFQSAGIPGWCGEVVLSAFKDGPVEANPGVPGCGIVCANLKPESHAAAARLGRALVSIYEDAILPTGESGALLFNEYATR